MLCVFQLHGSQSFSHVSFVVIIMQFQCFQTTETRVIINIPIQNIQSVSILLFIRAAGYLLKLCKPQTCLETNYSKYLSPNWTAWETYLGERRKASIATRVKQLGDKEKIPHFLDYKSMKKTKEQMFNSCVIFLNYDNSSNRNWEHILWARVA